MAKPKITLEIDGTEELGELIERIYELTFELRNTLDKIRALRLDVQAKINQPPEKIDG